MLAFGIRYLNGWVAARSDPSSTETEWPPHPGRIFMALAAAHFQTGADPSERKALLWLEALEQDGEPSAPHLVAPTDTQTQRAVVTHYVPVNDKAGPSKALLQSVPLTRERQPRTFTRAWLENDTVFLVWPEANPDASVRSSLERLCGKVTRIGHSTSLVQMWLANPEDIGDPNWIPNEEQSEIRLRLATSGTLAELERRYNGNSVETFCSLKVAADDATNKSAQKDAKKLLKEKFSNEPPPQVRPQLSYDRGYARPEQTGTLPAHGTVLSPHFIVFRLERDKGPYRQLDLLCAPAIAKRWREALLTQCNDLSATARSVLSGHDAEGLPLEGAHLAFLPLAFVDHEQADGHLVGMGLALPADLSHEVRREVLRAVKRVEKLALGRLGVWRVQAVTESRPTWSLRAEVWTAYPNGATHWCTVTPVVLDRHPKAKDPRAYQREMASLVAQCCLRIGLSEPREVVITPVSTHLGCPPSQAFPRLQRKDGSLRRHTHAILVFDEPVCGPILIGAGRYRGYGVCRPIQSAYEGRTES